MNHDPLQTVSFWLAGPGPQHAPIESDVHADVCVVGAGMAGLSIAYEVLRSGRTVVVLDRSTVGDGETSRSTAQLGTALDERYYVLENLHGADGARTAAESHDAAIDRVERIVFEEGIVCGFERLDGYLVLGPNDGEDLLERELLATRRAGMMDTEIVALSPAPSLSDRKALRFPDQAQMNPARYTAGLASAITRRGGRIFAGTQVDAIEDGKPARVKTALGPVVTATDVVVATNSPINNLVTLHTKQHAYRTYVIAAAMPKGSVPRALYWDTTDPYHYVRLDAFDPEFDWLVVGGEDHKTGQEPNPSERWTRLEEWMRAHFPQAGSVGARWSGQIMQSVDGLGLIGKNPGEEHVYVVTGDSGTGITHGALAGMLLSDLVTGHDNPWSKVYSPSRVTLKAGGTFLKQNLGALQPYVDWVQAGSHNDERQIARGQGAVVRQGLKLLAVFCDQDGKLHRRNAACPHLGGVVRWNEAESTWDCPCHGSRFDATGKVLNGPANVDLHVEPDPVERSRDEDDEPTAPSRRRESLHAERT